MGQFCTAVKRGLEAMGESPFLNLAGTNRSATTRICTSCGRIDRDSVVLLCSNGFTPTRGAVASRGAMRVSRLP